MQLATNKRVIVSIKHIVSGALKHGLFLRGELGKEAGTIK